MKCVKCVVFMLLAKAVCYGDAWKDYHKACKLVSALDLSSETLCKEAENCKITNRVTFFMQIQFCGIGVHDKNRQLIDICKERFKEVGQQLPKAKKLLKAFDEVFCDRSHLLNYYAMMNNGYEIAAIGYYIKCVRLVNSAPKLFATIYEIYKTCIKKYNETQ